MEFDDDQQPLGEARELPGSGFLTAMAGIQRGLFGDNLALQLWVRDEIAGLLRDDALGSESATSVLQTLSTALGHSESEITGDAQLRGAISDWLSILAPHAFRRLVMNSVVFLHPGDLANAAVANARIALTRSYRVPDEQYADYAGGASLSELLPDLLPALYAVSVLGRQMRDRDAAGPREDSQFWRGTIGPFLIDAATGILFTLTARAGRGDAESEPITGGPEFQELKNIRLPSETTDLPWPIALLGEKQRILASAADTSDAGLELSHAICEHAAATALYAAATHTGDRIAEKLLTSLSELYALICLENSALPFSEVIALPDTTPWKNVVTESHPLLIAAFAIPD